MNGLRPEQNGFRFLNPFGASKCIVETDPPARGFRSNFTRWLATAAAMSDFLAAMLTNKLQNPSSAVVDAARVVRKKVGRERLAASGAEA
jgi:hypothetical protein